MSTKAKTVAVKTKPTSQWAAKSATKTSPAGKAKVIAKPALGKTTVKASKPVAKPVAKAKPAAKTKLAAKSKPVVKPKAVAKTKPVTKTKPVAKTKPVIKTKLAVKSKLVVKPKAVAKTKPATQPMPVVKAGPSKVSKPTSTVAKPVDKAPAKSQTPSKPVKVAVAEAAAPVLAPKVLTPPPVKPRVSSRLASLTVPSMAQSVASTAAKASFQQTMPVTLIVPPLPSSIKKDPKLANNWKAKPADKLTDAELMAMPDSEYMNDKQLGAFRSRLQLLKQDMLNNAGETSEHLREDTVVVPDPADRATIEEEHALELRTRDRERKLLKKIEQSINLIDAGEYGYCDETGEPIGVGRLLARPTATLSLEAQQRRELKQKMFGD